MDYRFGYPTPRRKTEISEAINSSKENYQINYQGKYRPIPVIEVRIELLVYRIENIRTKSLQREWLAKHLDLSKSFFKEDPYCIEVQETQHQILKSLASDEGLLSEFKSGKTQQTEPLICSDEGVVVNGNRRLCAWRELYYSDTEKYRHFQMIRVAVLPNHDFDGMYDLEVALQIHSDHKAKYIWHTVAADCKEQAEKGIDIKIIASKQNRSPDETRTLIECYDYAAQYLDSIGHPDEWSRVDKQDYAFRKIIAGRKSLVNRPADRELFQEIAKFMLAIPAEGNRLYDQIPRVVKNLPAIATKLQEVFAIDVEEPQDDDIDLLAGEDSDEGTSNLNAQIAAGIRLADDPQLVVRTVQNVLETTAELEKEKEKKSYILNQVMKAAALLKNAVSALNPEMSKDGVERQLDNIEAAYDILRDWIS